TQPDVSPDGEWLAFQTIRGQEDLFVSRVDGTRETQLTNDSFKDKVPRWSPDGRRISFYSNRSGQYEVWIINRDGSGLQQITHDPTGQWHVIRSVWSPDGAQLAVNQVTNQESPANQKDTRTIVTDLHNNIIQTLPPLGDPETEWFDVWSWSPDGQWLGGRRVI